MNTHIDARIQLIKDIHISIRNEENINLDNLTVRIEGGRFFLSFEDKELTFETVINYFDGKPTDESLPVLTYKNHTVFFVANIDEIVQVENGSPYMNKGHIKIFMDAIIPTIRGILVEKTRGTSLEKAYLPLVQGEKIS
ncbi:hypothetical protein [Fibrella arboris]|uniref:hypothetical protein n=1 Tax=Fibrella arboris TaxID=3242486 RepID=UPI00352142C6